MASGHVNRTNRPNTWLHRPSLRREKSPCQLGAVHTCQLGAVHTCHDSHARYTVALDDGGLDANRASSGAEQIRARLRCPSLRGLAGPELAPTPAILGP